MSPIEFVYSRPGDDLLNASAAVRQVVPDVLAPVLQSFLQDAGERAHSLWDTLQHGTYRDIGSGQWTDSLRQEAVGKAFASELSIARAVLELAYVPFAQDVDPGRSAYDVEVVYSDGGSVSLEWDLGDFGVGLVLSSQEPVVSAHFVSGAGVVDCSVPQLVEQLRTVL